MKTLFHEQFRYNQWANDKLLTFVADHNLKNNRINPIFSHLTLAQVIWCDRLYRKITPVNINEWATWPWEEIEEKCRRTNEVLIDFVEKHADDDFGEIIEFINTSGTPYMRSTSQILIHVAQYTNFHRGQIVALIHQDENLITPSLDFIDFVGR